MNGDDPFNMVSEVYRSERRSKTLTKLPINFFQKAEEYLAKQKEEYSKAILLPSNPKAMMLQDQIKKLEKRLNHIYEIRERKITLAALDRGGGSNVPDNLTRRDKELFSRLVDTLKSFREGAEPPAPPEKERVVEVKEAQTAIVEPEPEVKKPEEKSFVVRVLEDMPSFTGTQHNYNLRKDDMVTLPRQVADLLSSKGKVRIIEAT